MRQRQIPAAVSNVELFEKVDSELDIEAGVPQLVLANAVFATRRRRHGLHDAACANGTLGVGVKVGFDTRHRQREGGRHLAAERLFDDHALNIDARFGFRGGGGEDKGDGEQNEYGEPIAVRAATRVEGRR